MYLMPALPLTDYVWCWRNTNASLDTLALLSPFKDMVLQWGNTAVGCT
jgi:hypothetical protein